MRNLNSTRTDWTSGSPSSRPDLAVAQWLRSGLRRWGVMLATRRQRLDLRELDDRTLRDIGVTRIDVEREASRHFWDIGDRTD